MMTTTPSAVGRESELREHYADVRARLWNGKAPTEREPLPRPVSPFARAARERREEQARRVRERLERIAEAILPPDAPHWYVIICEVAKKHGLKPREIRSLSRCRPIIRARNECFWRMRREITVLGKPISLPLIGRKFGDVDHTTVLHGIQRHQAAIENERTKNPVQSPVPVSPAIHTSSHPPEQIEA